MGLIRNRFTLRVELIPHTAIVSRTLGSAGGPYLKPTPGILDVGSAWNLSTTSTLKEAYITEC